MSDTTHQLNSTFLTLGLMISNIKKVSPAVIQGYRQAASQNLFESSVPERQLVWLQSAIEGLSAEVEKLKALVSDLQSK